MNRNCYGIHKIISIEGVDRHSKSLLFSIYASRVVLGVVLLCVFSLSLACAQDSHELAIDHSKLSSTAPAPSRQPLRVSDGLELLNHALAALGDPNAAHANASCTISATVASPNAADTLQEWTIEPHNYLTVTHGANGTASIGSQDPIHSVGNTHTVGNRIIKTHFVASAAPLWLARAVALSEISVTGVRQETVSGSQLLIVQTSDTSSPAIAIESQMTWYFSPDSFLPSRVDYRIPSISRSGVAMQAHVLFSGYQKTDVGVFPKVATTYIGETVFSTATFASATCSPQLHNDSYFRSSRGNAQ